MNPWAIALIAFIALFILASIVIAILLFIGSCKRLKQPKQLKPEEDCYYAFKTQMDTAAAWFAEMNAEELWIESYDGLKLFGRLLVQEDAKGTVLMMHGYHGEAMKDFAASMRYCFESGYNLLLPDERTHGRSEGRFITFGVRERHDVLSWLTLINERIGAKKPIFLHGVSMGCSTVLMASGLNLPDNVRGIVADCGYTRPWDICASVVKNQMHLPVFPILYIVSLFTLIFAGFGMRQASAPRALAKNTRPVIFYHGGKDDFVPVWMGNANYVACTAEKKQIIVAQAEHAQSFLVEQQRCLEEMGAFLEKYRA